MMTSACGSQVEEEARTRTDAGSPCTRLTCTWPSPTPTSRATRHRAPCQPDNKTWGRNLLSERLASKHVGREKLAGTPPPLQLECARKGCLEACEAVGRGVARAHAHLAERERRLLLEEARAALLGVLHVARERLLGLLDGLLRRHCIFLFLRGKTSGMSDF